jgi:hypothetical protein
MFGLVESACSPSCIDSRWNLMAHVSRIVSAFVLFAALAWIALPGAVFAAPTANPAGGEACPCCDGLASAGPVLACPGCQAATPAEGELPGPARTVSRAWTRTIVAGVAGIEPAPAEPPPR